MNIDKIENALNEANKYGVKFSQKNYGFYSLTKEGCYLVGVYKGSEKKKFSNKEAILHIFDLRKGVLENKDKKLVDVTDCLVGIFSTSKLDYLLTHKYNKETKKMEKADRVGKLLVIVYNGMKDTKTKEGKEIKVHNFLIREL
jgi:hypothetical protein